MGHRVYLFHCPVHGNEEKVFCFRAFEKENRHLWTKFEMIWEQDDWEEGEKDKLLEICNTQEAFTVYKGRA